MKKTSFNTKELLIEYEMQRGKRLRRYYQRIAKQNNS